MSDTSTTTLSPPVKPASNNHTLAICLGVIIPVVLIVAAVVVFIFVRRRRNPVKFAQRLSTLRRMSTLRRLSTINRSHKISVGDFSTRYHTRQAQGKVEAEFRQVQEFGANLNERKSRRVGQEEVNRAKNRFVDIIPYDDTLVQLERESGTPPSNYINASYIQGPVCGERYIATQGPKRNTVVDFWNMILEHRVATIVCLTDVEEKGKARCFQYWPSSGESLHFDDHILVHTKEETETKEGDFIIRKIQLSREGQEDEEEDSILVTQFHLKTWNDEDDEDRDKDRFKKISTGAALNLCNSIASLVGGLGTGPRKFKTTTSSAISAVVHCGTGVDRTGTFLATLFLVQEIAEKKPKDVDVFAVVKGLRAQRCKMVQTAEQYNFIYTCIEEFINSTQQGKRCNNASVAFVSEKNNHTLSGGETNSAVVC